MIGTAKLGLGTGWRPEFAHVIDRRADLGFVELMAEEFDPSAPLPAPIDRLRRRGVQLVPHGVFLSLGGAELPDEKILDHLARLATAVNAPLVTEHIAFVRAGGIESGHLVPVARTRRTLDLLVERVRWAQAALPVPLGLENIATLIEWPEAELAESEFLSELLDRTGALLLLDVENLYANSRNLGSDPLTFLDQLPLDRICYVHVAGGHERAGNYHDTHTDPVPAPVFDLLAQLSERVELPGVMLERDDNFPSDAEWNAEMDAIVTAIHKGEQQRSVICANR